MENYQGVGPAIAPAVLGVSTLPNTGGNVALRYTALVAIATGVIALGLQVAVAIYRRTQ